MSKGEYGERVIASDSYERYAVSDVAAKKVLLDRFMSGLAGKNVLESKLELEKTKNSYLLGDAIRRSPILTPAFDGHVDELIVSGCLEHPDLLSFWMDQQGRGIFLALSVAMQRNHPDTVAAVIDAEPDLFRGAAHVAAARYDLMASWQSSLYPNIDRDSLFNLAYEHYVDEFAEMIRQEVAEAKWLPLNPEAPKWGTDLP